jgi:hypothetical protein
MIEFDEILTVACLRPMQWENGFIVSKLLRKNLRNLIFPFLSALLHTCRAILEIIRL